MLSRDARDQVRDAIRYGLDPAYDTATVWIDIDHPEYEQASVTPHLLWRYEDVDTGEDGESIEPPYTKLILSLSPSGVSEGQGVSDIGKGRTLEERDVSDGSQDANLLTIRGTPVYDECNIMVSAQGGESIPGASEEDDYLTADDRAEAVCDAVRDFLLKSFTDPPLDAFDAEGNLVEDPNTIHGQDIYPPINRTSPVRGAEDVTDRVDANGRQWDSAVRLHYFDLSEEWSFTPTDVDSEVNTQINSN